ncbi:MAG: rhamnogalacturonan acetylesterase [Oscillospiraceae bacterium]|nr:rhamnogalacturonan acetylesterase [Oscillospiraceae bacterium]
MATVFYIGDSTVTYNRIDSWPQQGMSNALGLYLKEGVTLSPHGRNGRSTKSFLDEGAFDAVIQKMQAGDFLLIQFGHNDEKDDPLRHTDPQTSYKKNLTFFIRRAREKGAYPVLITSIARRLFDEAGNFRPGSHGLYPEAVRELGRELDVPVADLTSITEEYLARVGDNPSKGWFMWPKDNTHLKPEGAMIMASFLAQELRRMGSPYSDILI